MGWFDDLRARVEQSQEYKDISSYLQNRAVDAVVKVIEPPKGNQTAAQISSGQAGAAAQNAVIVPMSPLTTVKNYLPLILLGVGAYYLLKPSRRG